MKLGILGRKVGMTQIFDENGAVVPITVLDTSDCFITQVKTKDKEKYNALQVAFGKCKPQNVNKSRTGHFKKANVAPRARLKEIRFEADADLSQFKAGASLSVGMFAKGDRVDIVGLSKGKGFQGVIKRHGFHGADATHGVHEYFRHGGSIGTNTFPGRTLKNKGMPGHTGNVRSTVVNLEVVDVRPEANLLFLRGAVPGAKNGILMVRSSKRSKAPEGRTWTI